MMMRVKMSKCKRLMRFLVVQKGGRRTPTMFSEIKFKKMEIALAKNDTNCI